jgi:hypothetical protein
MPNAWAMALMFFSATFRSPRSIPPIYVRSRPHRVAKDSWEKPGLFAKFSQPLPEHRKQVVRSFHGARLEER